jgi:cell surface protein SprA
LNDKFLRTYSNQVHVKTTIEPFNNFKINLENNRTYSQNQTQYLSNQVGTSSPVTTNGSFSISTNAINTNPIFNSNISDRTYTQFKSNILIVARRMNAEHGGNDEIDPVTKIPKLFKASSQDVLIPSFLAAYTGQSASKINVDNYFTPIYNSFSDFLRSINWKINYNGLSDVKFLKPYFKTITITHGYNCVYSISNYQTFTSDNIVGANRDLYTDLVDGATYLAPRYTISAVSIDERFNPIIGVDTKLQNNITTKFEIRNNRTISMSLVNTEISEVGGYEYIAGVGYVFKNFTVNIKTAGTSKAYTNDINTRIDVSVRDNTTIRRTIADDVKSVIQGQKIWSLKWFADYMLTKQFTVRAFFDWTINQPRTNGFMTSNKNFGINLRFSLI